MLLFISLVAALCLFAEDGYRLWLRYDKIDNGSLLQQYRNQINSIIVNGSSPTLAIAKNELLTGLQGLLDKNIPLSKDLKTNSIILQPNAKTIGVNYDQLGSEGFAIISSKGNIYITADRDIGVLYGVFHFLRLGAVGVLAVAKGRPCDCGGD